MEKKHAKRKKYHYEEIIEKRDRQCGNKPWNPLTHCLFPLIELLDHNRFHPSKWPDWGPPSKLTCEYMAVNVDRCRIWLQNNVNSETAREFREKLDSCERQWEDWTYGVSDAGGYIYSPGFETWFEAHREWKEKWSTLWYDVMCVQRYVYDLTCFLNDKIGQGQPDRTTGRETESGARGDSAGTVQGQTGEMGNTLQYVFKSEGATWRIIYGEHETTVDDIKGVQYIHFLMKTPGTPIECLDIERACSDAVVRDVKTVDSEEALDADLHRDTFNLKQLEDYDVTTIQRAKGKLEGELESETDPSRKAELEEQIHAFAEYLGKNVDIHGKGRPCGERAKSRKNVSNAINRAKRNISKHNAAIGAHFNDAVKADNTAFVYRPDRRIDWTLS